jgi:methionyl-tRNA synthetase
MGLSKNQQITPKCCKKVQEKQTVFLSYSGYDKEYEEIWYGPDEDENKKPADRKKMYERHKPLWVSGHWDSKFNCLGTTRVKFCPHCSRPVPEIKRRKTTRKIRSITDGGHYCDTCGERIIECNCYRPEYAWEPDTST